MSNYNSLKTTINANVKQNGRQEITGQILNSVLNQMVTTLGTGYQFAGVATTATSPGSPDAKVFYIANGKGTYTNFGGVEVTEDDVVVLYWDSSWHKVSTGIASQVDLSNLADALESLDVQINGREPVITYVDNEYVSNVNGAFLPYNGWSRTDYINIKGIGDYLYYNNSGTSTQYNQFYDADKNPLGFGAIQVRQGGAMNVPSGAEFFVFSNNTSNMDKIELLNLPSVAGLVERVENSESVTEELSEKIGDVKKFTREQTAGTQWFEYPFKAGHKYRFVASDGVGSVVVLLAKDTASSGETQMVGEIWADDLPNTIDVTATSGFSYFRMYKGNTNPASVSVQDLESITGRLDAMVLQSEIEQIRLVTPSKIVGLVGEQVDIHYDNIYLGNNAGLSPWIDAFGDAPYIGMKKLVRFNAPSVRESTFSLRALPYGYINPIIRDTPLTLIKQISYKSIAENTGEGLSKNVLVIGDSITANGFYVREMMNLFGEDSMNVRFLGTMGNGGIHEDLQGNIRNSNGQILVTNYHFDADGYVYNSNNELQHYSDGSPMIFYHEGHGGWTSKDFCTSPGEITGYVNAFLNPTSERFDFSYYMSQYAIKHPGVTGVDYVFINLGINDVAKIGNHDEIMTYYNEMITSIRAFNSSIKILLGLCILPSEYEYTNVHSISQRNKTLRLAFHERLIADYDNREDEGYIIVPLHTSIDCEHDFNSVQAARSFRDSTLVNYCTDNVHPGMIAYNKIADRCRTYIKYATTI